MVRDGARIGRSVRSRRCARVARALPALALAVLLAVPAVSTAVGWSRPFRFDGPLSGDVIGPELRVSASGQAAVTFAVTDEDRPWVSQAIVAWRSARGRLSSIRVPGAKQVLDAAFTGQTLELLTGSGPSGQACCSAAQALTVQGSSFANRQTLLSGLTGATVGRLLALPGRGSLATLATDRAVWTGQWQPGRRGRPMRRLSGGSSWPQALAAASLAGGRDVVTWSAAPALTDSASSVEVATGSARHSPLRARAAVTLPPGYAVDSLAVAPRRAGATLAWTESWFDPAGAYRSGVAVADLAGTLQPMTFEFPGQIVGGLALSAGPGGDQALAVRVCDLLGSCSVYVSTRSLRGAFGQPQPLGAADASQEPVAAVGARGAAVIAWIAQGQVFASGRRSASAPFSAPHVVSGVSDAADLTLAFGSGGQALASWDQGAPTPSVMGATYGP